MKKSIEIKKKIENKVAIMNAFYNENKIDDALEVANEIELLNKELSIAELAEKHAVENVKPVEPQTKSTPTNLDTNRIFNKMVVGMPLNDAEKEHATNNILNLYSGNGQLGDIDEKGGYLLPVEQEQTILEFRKNLTQLKSFTRQKKVTTRTGNYTKAGENKLKLIKFDEMETLDEGDVSFAKADWSVANYGLLLPISNLLLDDLRKTNVRIVDFCGSELAKASVRTENEEIFKCVKANIENATSTGATLSNVNDLADMIRTIKNKDLASEYRANAKIFTTEDGFTALDNMKYADGRHMLQEDITVPTGKKLYGMSIVIIEGCEDLFDTYSSDVQFFIGDMEEFITFRYLQGTQVAMNESIGFKNNVSWLKITERFGVEAYNPLAMKFVEFNISGPKKSKKAE